MARRHHTVPRFLLDRFAKDGRIGTIDLPDRRFVQSTINATAENNFYGLDEAPGQTEDAFEQVLAALETASARVIREVLDEGQWPLPLADRHILAEFVAVQFLRGPDMRRRMDEIAAAMTQMKVTFGGRGSMAAFAKEEWGIDVTSDQEDRIWADVTAPGGPPIKHTGRAHAQQIVSALPEVFPYFLGRPWSLIQFQRKSLYVCDSPGGLVPHDPPEGAGGIDDAIGLANAWGITLPLSRRAGLLMHSPDPIMDKVAFEDVATGHYDSRGHPSSAHAQYFNASTITSARRWLFHHPDDVVPSGLPWARESEMDIRGSNFADPDR